MKEEIMLELLGGKYRVMRLDKLNITYDKFVMKKETVRRDKDGNEKTYGGYEDYVSSGKYYGAVLEVIEAIYEDMLLDNLGEKELRTIATFKKNILKMKDQIIEEVRGAQLKLNALVSAERTKGGKEEDDE